MVPSAFKGAMINDHINGRTLDEPEFLPFWKAAEQLGALILFHQAGETVVSRAHEALPPAQHHWQLGGPGGDLCLAGVRRRHGCLPRSQDLSGSRRWLYLLRHWTHGPRLAGALRGPSCISASPPARICGISTTTVSSTRSQRCAISSIPWAIDRVVFGTDWPYDMVFDWPVSWILSLESLSQEKKKPSSGRTWNAPWGYRLARSVA